MQLAGSAAHANVARAAHRFGIEMAGAEEIEERRLGIDRRDDGLRVDLLAAFENDADDAVVFDLERLYSGVGADLDAHGLESRTHRFGNHTHAALRNGKTCLLARGFGGQSVEKQQQRIRRAGPEVRAEHGIECHARLSDDHPRDRR